MSCRLRGWLTASSVAGPGRWLWAPEPDLLHDGADLATWEADVTAELGRPAYAGAHVELFGGFPNDAYLTAWLDIARALPDVEFSAVTADTDRMARLAEPDAPDNFTWAHPDEQHTAAGRGPEREDGDCGDNDRDR